MNKVKIVIPYIHDHEIQELRDRLYNLPVVFWKDHFRIGSDLAYQTLWHMYNDCDIIILHADMLPLHDDLDNQWFNRLCDYANSKEDGGIFGTTLLYPAKDSNDNYIVQHAGGVFVNNEALHVGGGLDLYSGNTVGSRELITDTGQFNGVWEVEWVTFGGCYIKRSVINDIPFFDPSYYWTYYRDVDYCLEAKSAGYKIYQTDVKLFHFEGKDNKRLQYENTKLNEKVNINHSIFLNKWGHIINEKSNNTKPDSSKNS